MQSFIYKLFLGAAVAYMSACVKNIKHEGVVLDEEEKQNVLSAKMTKDQIRTSLGTPSFILAASGKMPEVWYYVSSEKYWYAFFNADIEKQTVLEIEFDGETKIASREYTEKDIPSEKQKILEGLKNYKKPA